MPDPDTDINPQEIPDLEGPDEDDAEAAYDPTGYEASRARELGLGLGERELERQRDVRGSGQPSREGDVERIDPDTLSADDSIADSDADNLTQSRPGTRSGPAVH